ncbi:DUF5110 domain-containing protein [Streptomyces umbrinus]|uniref:DUF5110 domain-containing protein n=1 Tax=Streptomyces umbrinus TaxID=67370 RepID=UPI003436AC42
MPADVVADGGQTGGRRFAGRVTDFGLESAPGGDGVTRASGRYNLYEDDGTTTKASQSATTGIKYTETGSGHTLRIGPATGSFHRQVTHGEWTVKFLNARASKGISVNGEPLAADAHHWDGTTRTLTVELPRHNIDAPLTLAYH